MASLNYRISYVEIKGLKKLVSQLQAKAARAMKASGAKVVVGFTSNHALPVHENTEQKLLGQPRPKGHIGNYWQPGQPKFLEEPFRRLNEDGTFAAIIKGALGQGKTMAQALLICGLRLQREAQLLCPVDTGNLKSSAFTRLEA